MNSRRSFMDVIYHYDGSFDGFLSCVDRKSVV